MDRITERTDHEITVREELDICVDTPEDYDNLQHILSVLAAYEDLGITPEQLQEILTNNLDPIEMCKVSIALDKLKEYQEAERQGRLLHLPCKAGDTVYLEAEYENEITEGRVWKKEF